MVRKLAEELGGHPGLALWHISNELGGECWCDHCRARFTEFLRRRYEGDIERLNHEWWTTFWSHRYSSFEQVEPPWPNGETSIHGLNLDWKRFTTWNMNDYLLFEAGILREFSPNIPITTNFMRLYPGLDYHQMAPSLDIVSWDSYPVWGTDSQSMPQVAAETAFEHAVMRGMKPEKPYMLMESVPSQVNSWQPYNKLKRPGVHLLSSLQAIACGSDTVQYFQWRKGRGSYEQFHGAVVDHLGRSDTRTFADVAETGAALQKLAGVAGTLAHAETALLFDWDNRWAIGDSRAVSQERKQYEGTCRAQYGIFLKNGVPMDVISPLADFSRYKVLVAPMLYLLKPGVAARLRGFVQGGGQLVAGYLTGYVNENTLCWLGGFPGDGLTGLFGLYAEEIDVWYPGDANSVRFEGPIGGEYAVRDYCEVLKLQGAQVLAGYGGDFYAGTPAVTRNAVGGGAAWYAAARIEDAGMEALYQAVWQQAGIAPQALPRGVEHYRRTGGGQRYDFYLNWTDAPQQVAAPAGQELLAGQPTAGGLRLPPMGAAVVLGRE
jgi:beta-galactosidase